VQFSAVGPVNQGNTSRGTREVYYSTLAPISMDECVTTCIVVGAVNSHMFFEFIVYGAFMSSWLILFAVRSSTLFDEKCVEIVKKIRVAS